MFGSEDFQFQGGSQLKNPVFRSKNAFNRYWEGLKLQTLSKLKNNLKIKSMNREMITKLFERRKCIVKRKPK